MDSVHNQAQSTIKIYIAQALTKAPEEFKEKLKEFRKGFCAKHAQVEILDFVGLDPNATAAGVAIHDFKQVLSAHLILDFVEIESSGEGREIGMAYALGIPVLSVAPEGVYISRMTYGPADIWPGIVIFRRYKDIEDVHDFVEEAIHSLRIVPQVCPARLALHVPLHIERFFQQHVLNQPSGWKS